MAAGGRELPDRLGLSVAELQDGGTELQTQALAPLGLAADVSRLAWLGVESAVFRRGFVEMVEMGTPDFVANAAVLFRTWPILDVRLTDREPALFADGGAAWVAPGVPPAHAELPAALWCLLPSDLAIGRPRSEFYFTRTALAAQVALAVACVRHGRNLARLPRLD
jgi:hypothetical protein